MSFLSSLKCTRCGKEFDVRNKLQICSKCEGVLNIKYDYESIREKVSSRKLGARRPGVWKYRELLPIKDPKHIISLGEGGTYLHKCRRLAEEIGLKSLYLKDETTNPTGSFIDRGMSVQISGASELGASSVCCGSTGNLAASLVAYAARAGLDSKVFISQEPRVDIGKFYQILAYAMDIVVVRDRIEAMAEALQEGKVSHCVTPHSPYFLEGVKTTSYEICEQLDWKTPDWIITPMGNGGHLSMIWKGLDELMLSGLIKEITSKMGGSQAKGCAPIADAFNRDDDEIIPCKSTSTIAIDIGVKAPTCGHSALEALKESKGAAQVASDSEIIDAVRSLARLEGVFAEPASATTIAVLKKLVRLGKIDRSDTVVCLITGMGLKYPEITRTLVKGRGDLEHLLSRVEGRKVTTKLGRTKVQILKILRGGESYGYDIWKKLRDDYGISVKIPSVYQHLNELTSSGLVVKTRSEQTMRKTMRNYYGLSEKGRWTLTQLEELSR